MTQQQLGEFIKQQRLLQNLTQNELASKIGCRRQVVLEIENCQCNYGIDIIIKVLAALGYQLVPTPLSTELPKYERNVLFNFSSIKVADVADDPYLQDRKRDRIFAQSKRKTKNKTV